MAVFKPANSKFYHYRFMLNGKIRTGSTKTANKQAAERFEAQVRLEAHKVSELGEKERITIKDALQNYLDTKRKMRNYRNFTGRVNKVLGLVYDKRARAQSTCYGLDGDSYLDKLTAKDIQRLIFAREKEGLKPQSLLPELVTINQTLNLAKRMGYKTPDISVADLRKDNSIKSPKGKIRFLTLDEEQRLLTALHPETLCHGVSKGPNYKDDIKYERRQDAYDLVILLLDTGARHGEIASLSWANINMMEQTIDLFRPKVQNQSTLHMTGRVYEILHRRFHDKDRGQYVFTNGAGDECRQHTLALFKRACNRAEIPNATLHTLRHTFASRMVQAGLPLADVQQILGHATIQMTLNYAHLAPLHSSQKAVALMNKINTQHQIPALS